MNLTLSELERAGYEGCDVSLEISLFEYGLIWKKFSRKTTGGFKKGEYRFIYGANHNGREYTGFGWAGNVHETTNPKREWNWVNWEEAANYTGFSVRDFLQRPVHEIVYDLLCFYGYENVFGPTYHEFSVGTKSAPRWSEETLAKRRRNRNAAKKRS